MRLLSQNLVGWHRLRFCSPHALAFLVLNTCMIVVYGSISAKALRNKTQSYFSAYADRDQFMKAIGQFSKLRVASRFIAGRELLNAEDLGDSDRALLRFFIIDYLEFHRTNRANSTRSLIYRPRKVGNGDRFDCMLFAYWAAVLSKRVFLLDWDEPLPLSLFLTSASAAKLFLNPGEKNMSFSNQGQCTSPNCVLLSHEHMEGNYYEKALSSKTKTVFMHTHKIPLTVTEEFLTQHLPKNISSTEVHRFRSSETFRRAVLHHVLRLTKVMVREYNKIAAEIRLTRGATSKSGRNSLVKTGFDYISNNRRRSYIAVHARLGKGVGEFSGGRFKDVSLRMTDVAMCLASRAVRLAIMSGSPPLPIFLATDTVEFREVFKVVAEEISGGGVDVVFGNWSTVHVGKVSRKDMNTGGSDDGNSWDSLWGGFMDLVLLGHAEHIVALYSGFPRLALALGDAQTLVELRNEICLL